MSASPRSDDQYLIYHPEFGVYLGFSAGRGYWSKVNAAGQPGAVVFPSRQEAVDYLKSWRVAPPPGIELLKVVADNPGWASIAACVRAGAPAWLDRYTPTANGSALPM